MAFNINVIPAENRTKEQIEAHLEMYRKANDIVRVYNPTDEDFIVYNDRMVSNESYIIPNKNRDIGKGKGMMDVKRFIADRYIKKMGHKLISQKSKEDWDKRKKTYRQEEWGTYEERLGIRLNDRNEWKKVLPILYKGIVERYQDNNMLAELPPEPKKKTGSMVTDLMEELNLTDYELGVEQIEDKKESLINDLS